MTDTAQVRGIGDNLAPDDLTILRERLAEQARPIIDRRDELLGAVDRAPLEVETEEIAGKVADLIVMLNACAKNAESARVSRKEPFLASGRAVDGFYKSITDPLEMGKTSLSRRLTAFQRRKAEDERRRRDEEARLAKEAADRKTQEAAQAAQALATEAELPAAIEKEADAKQAQADATGAQKAAEAKPAELSRSRSELGAVASLRRFWDFRDLDRETIDLEKLRPYLAIIDIEKAVRGAIKAGVREMKGVEIFENTATQVH